MSRQQHGRNYEKFFVRLWIYQCFNKTISNLDEYCLTNHFSFLITLLPFGLSAITRQRSWNHFRTVNSRNDIFLVSFAKISQFYYQIKRTDSYYIRVRVISQSKITGVYQSTETKWNECEWEVSLNNSIHWSVMSGSWLISVLILLIHCQTWIHGISSTVACQRLVKPIIIIDWYLHIYILHK